MTFSIQASLVTLPFLRKKQFSKQTERVVLHVDPQTENIGSKTAELKVHSSTANSSGKT
jgi:hypothetical protein